MGLAARASHCCSSAADMAPLWRAAYIMIGTWAVHVVHVSCMGPRTVSHSWSWVAQHQITRHHRDSRMQEHKMPMLQDHGSELACKSCGSSSQAVPSCRHEEGFTCGLNRAYRACPACLGLCQQGQVTAGWARFRTCIYPSASITFASMLSFSVLSPSSGSSSPAHLSSGTSPPADPCLKAKGKLAAGLHPAVLRLTSRTLSYGHIKTISYLNHRPHLMSSEGWLMISLYRSS